MKMAERLRSVFFIVLRGQEAAQRFALPAGCEKTAWEQYKPEARKMLVKRADSPASGARFVSPLLALRHTRFGL